MGTGKPRQLYMLVSRHYRLRLEQQVSFTVGRFLWLAMICSGGSLIKCDFSTADYNCMGRRPVATEDAPPHGRLSRILVAFAAWLP